MNISTTRGGVMTFYILTGVFAFTGGQITDPSDRETFIWVGRWLAAAGALPLILMGITELSRDELQQELNGRQGEEFWPAINKLLAWGSPVVAVWHFYKGNTWDGLMLLSYPSWLLLLWAVARRRSNKDGRRPGPFCKVSFYLSLASATLFFTLMITPGWGPALPGSGGYKLYPLLCLLSLLATLLNCVACGGDKKHD